MKLYSLLNWLYLSISYVFFSFFCFCVFPFFQGRFILRILVPTIILSLLATARQWRGEREGKEGGREGGREGGGREGGDKHID